MLRHASLSSVASLISNLRSHGQVSCIFWLLHSDLHEIRATSVFEYMSSMLASIQPMTQPALDREATLRTLCSMNRILREGGFKCASSAEMEDRVIHEEFCVEQSGINFTSFSTEDGMITQSLVPKVQFNLQLSEKEQIDRASVVLPFEHQGNGKSIQIYDGRRSLNEGEINTKPPPVEKSQKEDPGRGEIIYFRDSDYEMPDSDEDPDDDLDI